VRHWMHQGLVGLEGTKMSKSLGNLVFVSDVLKEWEAPALRLAILSNHYRQPWEWRDDMMDEAARRLEAWRSAGRGQAGLERVRGCLDHDLDTPAAVAAIDDEVAAGRGVSEAASLLGVA
jgi:L-cysteine:1D-myo-inositol 2-amino-2-deoxy-alpha-D-glucopyranoside ligase